jgi:hypothetical protein
MRRGTDVSIDLIRKPSGGGHPFIDAHGHTWHDILAGLIRHGKVLGAGNLRVHPLQKRLLDPIFAVGPGCVIDSEGVYHYDTLAIKFDDTLALTTGDLTNAGGYIAFVRNLPSPLLSDEERRSHQVWGG